MGTTVKPVAELQAVLERLQLDWPSSSYQLL
jgi:hypothetical protein